MKIKEKTPPDKKLKLWRSFPQETYVEALNESVDFSFKTVNSNAASGGIRLAKTASLDLPYISARTLLHSGISLETDYISNSGPAAAILRQVKLLLDNKSPEKKDFVSQIKKAFELLRENHYEIGTDEISPRLRQILLPNLNNKYVAVTPISSVGVCAEVSKRVDFHNSLCKSSKKIQKDSTQDQTPKWHKIRLAELGIGGSNPVNVGALVKYLNKPLFFLAPTQDPEIRKAYGLYFNAKISIPNDLMLGWNTFRQIMKQNNQGKLRTHQKARNQEKSLVLKIAAHIQDQAHEIYSILDKHRESLPNNGRPLLAMKVNDAMKWLIDPELRPRQWTKTCGKYLAKQITETNIYNPDTRIRFKIGLDDQAELTLAKWIEESLK